jgi:hypothetical protein
MSIGQVLAKSGYFKDTTDQAQAVAKVLAGQELGIGPVAALRGISFVMNKMTLDAGLVAALIQRSGRYDYRVIAHTEQECRIAFYDNGKQVGESRFTMADAQKAGLAGKDMWAKYPRNMLFARALTNGARWYCPGVFFGAVYTPDEVQETPPPTEAGPAPTPAPQPQAAESEQAAEVEDVADVAEQPAPAAEAGEQRPTKPQYVTRAQFNALVAKWLPRYRSKANPEEANEFAIAAHLRKAGIPTYAHPDAWLSLCKSNDENEGAPA